MEYTQLGDGIHTIRWWNTHN